MNKLTAFTRSLGATALLSIGLVIPDVAAAQTAKDLIGSWILVSNDRVNPDGSRTPLLGANPKGMIIFSSDGHYCYLLSRSDLPKIASGNRNTGTADEYKAIVQGTLAAFGTYAVAGKVITVKIEASTFPNSSGRENTREIVSFTGDELKWIVPEGSTGGTNETVLRRVK